MWFCLVTLEPGVLARGAAALAQAPKATRGLVQEAIRATKISEGIAVAKPDGPASMIHKPSLDQAAEAAGKADVALSVSKGVRYAERAAYVQEKEAKIAVREKVHAEAAAIVMARVHANPHASANWKNGCSHADLAKQALTPGSRITLKRDRDSKYCHVGQNFVSQCNRDSKEGTLDEFTVVGAGNCSIALCAGDNDSLCKATTVPENMKMYASKAGAGKFILQQKYFGRFCSIKKHKYFGRILSCNQDHVADAEIFRFNVLAGTKKATEKKTKKAVTTPAIVETTAKAVAAPAAAPPAAALYKEEAAAEQKAAIVQAQVAAVTAGKEAAVAAALVEQHKAEINAMPDGPEKQAVVASEKKVDAVERAEKAHLATDTGGYGRELGEGFNTEEKDSTWPVGLDSSRHPPTSSADHETNVMQHALPWFGPFRATYR